MIDALRFKFSEPVLKQIKVVAYVAVVAATVTACATLAFFTFQAATASLVAGNVVKAYAIRWASYGLWYSNLGHLGTGIFFHAFGEKDSDHLSIKVMRFVGGALLLSAVFAGFGAGFGAIVGKEVVWLSSAV